MAGPTTCGNITILVPVVTDASTEFSGNGSAKIKATYFIDVYPPADPGSVNTHLEFSLDNINWFPGETEASDAYFIFNSLGIGTYTAYVRARVNFITPWEYCSKTFSVGFTSADCSTLHFGTITSVGESTPGAHDGSITVGSSGLYAREFRLDTGAWQSSNIFNGLADGTYSVQVRYAAYPSCSLAISRTLFTCDVTITSIQVNHESAAFANDGTIFITATSSALPLQYSIDGGTSWFTSNGFGSLKPATYSVKVKDANNCVDSRTVAILKYKREYFLWPMVNSHRLVVTDGPLKDNLPQNFDNTLFSAMRYQGCTTDDYKEKFQSDDLRRVQWRSSYTNHLVEVRRLSDTVLIETLPVVKQHAFLNQESETTGKLANGSMGKIQLFFTSELPPWAVVGQTITLSATGYSGLNGDFVIEDITNGTGAASGNVVLILTAAWPGGAPSVVNCTIDTIYNVLPFDVYECAVDYSLLASGNYFLKVTCTDVQFDNTVGFTEPFNVSAKVDDAIEIVYFNNDNGFNMYYDTAIQNQIRVEGELRLGEPGGNETVMEDSERELIKVMEYVTRIVDVTIPHIPNYLRERISLALAHDNIIVNGIAYQKQEKPSFTPPSLDDLVTMTLKLRQVKFIAENSDDGGYPFTPDNPRIHDRTFDESYN